MRGKNMFLKRLSYSIFYLPFAPMKQDDTIDQQIDSAKEELEGMCKLLSSETRTWLQKFSRPKEKKSEIGTKEIEIEELDSDFE